MENHGVAAIRLPAEPTPGTFTVRKMWDKSQQKIINRVIPLLAIAVVYFATQLAAKWKVTISCVSDPVAEHQLYAGTMTPCCST